MNRKGDWADILDSQSQTFLDTDAIWVSEEPRRPLLVPQGGAGQDPGRAMASVAPDGSTLRPAKPETGFPRERARLHLEVLLTTLEFEENSHVITE